MPMDHTSIGRTSGWHDVTWTSGDSLLYALSVGAGYEDPTRELAFTTENSQGVPQRVLPTFGAALVHKGLVRPDIGVCDHTKTVLAAQELTLYGPLAVEGRARILTTVAGIRDRDVGALIDYDSVAVDAASGTTLLTARSTSFLKDHGGWGGAGDDAPAPSPPGRRPDIELTAETRREQALIYRLCGDRNPLHSDPSFARRCGFRRPILHGLCTYGITGRLLLHAVCGSRPEGFRSMSARFTRRVTPGETLKVVAWRQGGAYVFRTLDSSGAAVLDNGELVAAPTPPPTIAASHETD